MKLTFVICAYQDSPYLKECVESLKDQSEPCEIMLATATPSPYLKAVCEQYKISYCVREGKPGIAADWNYAFSLAKTPYVTIAHQDDCYYRDYAKDVLAHMKSAVNPLIAFTDYAELRDGAACTDGRNLKIKRILLLPLRLSALSCVRFAKRFVIRFGNAICCPAVTYHKEKIVHLLEQEGRKELFHTHFRSNLDWQTWEWLSRKKGAFVYLPKIRMAHRIHEESETSATIRDRQRQAEDYEMFCEFWPKCIAKMLTGCYGMSEDDNQV